MSQNRTSSKAGWTKYDQLARGPNGRGLCRWCSKEVPKGRRTFCGDECVHEYRLRSDPGYVRTKLFERDVGVCAICRTDTEAVQHVLRKALAQVGYREWDRAYEVANIPEKFRGFELSRTWWEADHIVPVVEGGGECGLEGFQTLCVPCHRDVTRELRGRLAKARKKCHAPTPPEAPGPTQAIGAAETADQPPKTQGTPDSGGSRGIARVVRTPVVLGGGAGVRHDGVSDVRRSGPDAQVQGRVSALSGTRRNV